MGNQVLILKGRWRIGQEIRQDSPQVPVTESQSETSHACNFSACCQREKQHWDRDLEFARALFWFVNRHVFICFQTSKPGPATHSHCSPCRRRKAALVHTDDLGYLWPTARSALQALHLSRQPAASAQLAGKDGSAVPRLLEKQPQRHTKELLPHHHPSLPLGQNSSACPLVTNRHQSLAIFPASQEGYLPLSSLLSSTSLPQPFGFLTLFKLWLCSKNEDSQ